ncbi:MAG: hypothetical protein QX189_03020 [Methylococcales bacterium]
MTKNTVDAVHLLMRFYNMSIETGVLQRYSRGTEQVHYSHELLVILPQEIIDKNEGCGDPSTDNPHYYC